MKNLSGSTYALLVGLFALVFAIMITALAQRFGWELVVGSDRSLLDATLTLGTFIGALGSLFFLYRRWMHDDDAAKSTLVRDRLTIMKGAAELLATDRQGSQTAAIGLLVGLAEKYPQEMGPICTVMLAHYVSDRSAEEWERCREAFDTQTMPLKFHRGDGALSLAICQLAWIRKVFGKWPGTGNENGLMHVDRWYLGSHRFHELTLDDIWIQNGVINDVEFRKCSLRNATLHLVVAGFLRFKDCDLSNTRLVIKDFSGSDLGTDAFSASVAIEGGCITEGMSIVAMGPGGLS
ncbi:hypothetical protein KD146_11285 [Devosia sp. BSSL-BM10]|uniref:Pentapeptide repeat-containing protein n=1 Tax=Devosia litorisediminis TaxID=2829817 RepID=A0A942I6T2_9HYPH|nr:hypothetical protein [Devosia litorisediminis]MBS3849278.1 hypothetical protein [Devosia litorisediminis]